MDCRVCVEEFFEWSPRVTYHFDGSVLIERDGLVQKEFGRAGNALLEAVINYQR